MSNRYQIESRDGTFENAFIRDTETGEMVEGVNEASIDFHIDRPTTLTMKIVTDDFCIQPISSDKL